MTGLKRVLVTGCSDHSIGSALAVQFQKKGWYVFATSRNPSTMSALENIPNITLLGMDVTKLEQLTAALEAIKKDGEGGLDVVVNNAAVAHYAPLLDTVLDEARETFEANFWGPLKVIKTFVPLLRESGGMVVNTSSIAGYANVPYLGVYSASKRALEILSETLRLELTPFNIKVLAVVTGPTKSNGGTAGKPPLTLPEDSLYKPIEATVAKMARGEDGAPREDTTSYAKKVVDDIIKGKTGKVWHGANAGTMNIIHRLAPQSVIDKEVSKGMDLELLAAKGGK